MHMSPQHGAWSRCEWRNGLQMWTVAANTLNKQSRTADSGCSSNLGLGEVLTTPRRKNLRCYETFHKASDLVQHKQWKMDMRFGTWNVRSLYRPRSLTTVARELASYRGQVTGTCECGNEPLGSIKCGGISWLAEDLSAFQEGLCSMELAS
jgi:hypothetical protein